MSIICSHHGIFRQTPSQHVRGKGCPKCKNSRGVQLIDDYLKSHKIPFVCEYNKHECYYQNKLLFDFAIFKDKAHTQLLFLLEFDGPQHYKSVGYFGGDEAFDKIQIRDRIKDEYCLTNSIRLVRIRYDEMNSINSILERELKIEG